MKLRQLPIALLAMAIALGAGYGVIALGEAAGLSNLVAGVLGTIAFAVPLLVLGAYLLSLNSN